MLILGNTYKGEYRTNICSWNLEFSALSKFQLFALNTKLYLNNCGCEVRNMVAYFCHHLSDNYVDLSDLYVVLSDLYVDLSVIYVDLSDHYVDLSGKNHHS